MTSFKVRYADPNGTILTRTLHGSDSASVKQNLQDDGFFVFSISREFSWSSLKSERIPRRQFLLFNREFKSMIRSGLPIVEGMDLLLRRMKEGPLRTLVEKVRSDLTRGEPLSQAFSHHAHRIPPYYPALIYAGEQAGNLEEVLERFLVQEDRMQRARKKFRNALTYPLFLLVVGMFALYIILGRAMPQFAGLYEGSGQEMPALTEFVIGLSNWVRANGWLLAIGLSIGLMAVLLMARTESGKTRLELAWMGLPLLGKLWRLQNQNVFARTLRLLLTGGTPLSEALAITADALPSKAMGRQVHEARTSLLDGQALEPSLAKVQGFDPLVGEMIRIGESAGSLNEMLEHLAENGEEQAEDLLELISNVLAPFFLLGVGLTIAILVLAMYLPMFGAADLVAGN
ncbi:MAG: type II secretion system F family protein [Acidobacteria bacterium]|nr:type II secretion system F family protein [Acidobacteriota bacterium]MCB9399698.1 type II secretion system F family protein [Acidobacteriota bacterium]